MDAHEQNQLVALWNTRCGATEAQWTQLYRLVLGALAGCGAGIMGTLNAERADLVHDFFYQKVFLTADRQREPLQHAGALCGFFRNYLKDRWRAQAIDQGREVELDEARAPDHDADDPSDPAPNTDAAHAVDADEMALLAEAGLSASSLMRSAEHFLDELGRDDTTYVLYLKLHLCPDEPLPLSTLARVHRIPSYHYRAERLGITGRKGGFAKGYDKTLIGQWLIGLGLPIEAGSAREIGAALAYLCAGALVRLNATSRETA